jgi:hypothetical protein
VVRQPWTEGPRWLGRLYIDARSWPSALKIGMKIRLVRSSRPSLPRSAMSRSSIIPASLPSISPEWMPAWASRMGLPGSSLGSGPSSGSLLTKTASRSRPWADLPKTVTFTSGEAASSFSSQARVSA